MQREKEIKRENISLKRHNYKRCSIYIIEVPRKHRERVKIFQVIMAKNSPKLIKHPTP